MKKLAIFLLSLFLILAASGCAGKETASTGADETEGTTTPAETQSSAEAFDRFLEEYAAFSALLNKDASDPTRECGSGRVLIIGDQPDLSGFEALGMITDPYGNTYVQFATPEKAQDFLKAQQAKGIHAEADTVIRLYDDAEWIDENDNPEEHVDLDHLNWTTADSSQAAASGLGSWGTTYIGAPVYASIVKSISGGSRALTVAVLDSGVDLDHSFLKDRLAAQGYDFVRSKEGAEAETSNHGCHVSGTIIDCTPGLNVKILPVRVAGHLVLNKETGQYEEVGYASEIALGIYYAVEHGASVINLSMGGGHNDLKDNAIRYAVSHGVTVCVSAGNDSESTAKWCPAHMNDNGVIVVSAINQAEKLASFSNFGASVDLAAPGVYIYSAGMNNNYTIKDGTSMAAPHVSAACAMVKLAHPDFTPAQIEDFLKGYAKDLGKAGRDDAYGVGALQLFDCDRDTVEKLWLASLPDKTEYLVGECFIRDGLGVMARYVDGTEERVERDANNAYRYQLSIDPNKPFDKAGTVTVTVSYKGMKVSFTVTVAEKPAVVLPAFDNPDPDSARPFNVVFSPNPEAPELDSYPVTAAEVKQYGVSYDRSTNTVTLNNVKNGWLRMDAAGNSLKIKVIGTCRIGYMLMDGWGHSGAVTFTGNGTLILDKGRNTGSIEFRGEYTNCCIIVEEGVSIKCAGTIDLHTSLLENSVFLLGSRDRLHGTMTSVAEEPKNQGNQWILDQLIAEMDPVPTVYHTHIEPDSSGYILIDP